MEETKERTYTYTTDSGKTRTITRRWKVKQEILAKRKELNDYFDQNADKIKNMKNITAVFNDYNNSHENKISYNLLYKKYISIYDSKKSKKQQNSQSSEASEEEAQ